ncbi:hypothetical protein SAY86_026238 [Trapa natans]|uniref:FAD-binding domain-containing protein n=1 Tax=Trapa natans TaxID=22666 RepID=A0AAN7KAI2_TRANT|nr:hypothetical protein SAY86_026238 [Trapa natans]
MESELEEAERVGVIIVGGGICGLATALALHRNGIASLVLEKSESLRATGSAIILQANGWRALDHLGLGIASLLRQASLPIDSGELRCVKRMDLIKSLADMLPSGTLKLGCRVTSIERDPFTRRPLLQLHNGNLIRPKVMVIGCDGVNSIVADAVGLRPPRTLPMCVVRGLTTYASGHGLENKLVVLAKAGLQLGRMPINHKQVYWFMTCRMKLWTRRETAIAKDSNIIRQWSVESLDDFPMQDRDMVARSDLPSLHLTDLKYRAPWDLIGAGFRRGPIAVAGDAMHAMGPFLAQGGSAALEDAIVLGRCLSNFTADNLNLRRRKMTSEIEEAIGEFVALRRRRVMRLSAQTYLMGLLVQNSSSTIVKLVIRTFIGILFGDGADHANYDCGSLSADNDGHCEL